MSTDSDFFAVHLQSLERFAAELESQLDAMSKPSDRLAGMAGRALPLGQFAEADALGARQMSAAEQMHGLLQAVREAVGFAGDVTRTIAAAYQRFDQQAADGYGALTPGGSPGTAVVGVDVAVPQPATVTVTGSGVAPGVPVTVTAQPVTYTDPAQAPQATPPVPVPVMG
jgi:hypothetical protein